MSDITVPKLNTYDRIIDCPPDKSISVRAVILAAYAVGRSVITNLSLCNDVLSAVDCVRRLGASVELDGSTARITGAAFRPCELDCGNSATAARLLIGLLSGLNGVFVIDGDESLRRRPMRRVIDPLRLMGARIEDTDGHLPVRIVGSPLHAIEYFMPIDSAQVKSALLFAALNAAGAVKITERIKTRDHTEIMLRGMNADISVDGNTVRCGRSVIFARDMTVPGDFSAAVFPLVLALCVKGGRCLVRGVGLNPTRTHMFEIMRRMCVPVYVGGLKRYGGEPLGNMIVDGGTPKPFALDGDDAARLIDEIPALCALACYASGKSVISGAGELRHKESDRITATVSALSSLGADITETENGIVVCGGKPLAFGTVDPMGDHRIAMAAAVAAAAGGGARIIGADCAAVSYPSFFEEVLGV